MNAKHFPQTFEREGAEGSRVMVAPSRASVLGDRTAHGLRIVVVARSGDGDDVVVACDGHGRHTWFSGVLTRRMADDAVCDRCDEERKLAARRAVILDAYGPHTFLRVLGQSSDRASANWNDRRVNRGR